MRALTFMGREEWRVMKETRCEESSVSDEVWLAAIILWQCLVYAALLWVLIGK